MKKFLGVASEIFLFCFLLLIFVIPVLVSLNLDPQLLRLERTQVAGVMDDNKEYLLNYIVEENLSATDSILDMTSTRTNNYYNIDFRVISNLALNERIDIGILENNSSNKIDFTMGVISDIEALRGLEVEAIIGDKKYILFNGSKFVETDFTLEDGGSSSIILLIKSDVPIQYPVDIKFDLRSVSKSIAGNLT